MSSHNTPDQGVNSGVPSDTAGDPALAPDPFKRILLAGSLGNPYGPLGKEPVIALQSKLKTPVEPDFPSRQALADFLFATTPAELVSDGYGVEDMPLDDKELQSMYGLLTEAYEVYKEATRQFMRLLPESVHTRRIREDREK